MSLTQGLIPWTLAVYLGFFFVYGQEVFTTDWGVDETQQGGFFAELLGFVADVVDFSGDLIQFITLGGASSPLPAILQTILLLTVGLGWFIVIMGMARGTAAS